jgi:hypothetical protein
MRVLSHVAAVWQPSRGCVNDLHELAVSSGFGTLEEHHFGVFGLPRLEPRPYEVCIPAAC